MTRSVLVVGGGIAGLATAYELRKLQHDGADLSFTLVEQSNRLGGILETERKDGFVVECGPDGWVSEKPWARDLAVELGLEDQLLLSNDAERVTYVLHNGRLEPMPDGMRMMVPANLQSLESTPLFSEVARAAYAAELARADELKRSAPDHDESVASFVQRHFGKEVLRVIGAPLLGGVFGGDVRQLSVRAVMKPFVEMEREHGSLIAAVQARNEQNAREGKQKPAIFTSLRNGTGALAEAMAATLPEDAVKLMRRVVSVSREGARWKVQTEFHVRAKGVQVREYEADALLLATPVRRSRALMQAVDARAAELLDMPTSSAVIVAFGFTAEQGVQWPRGFGFLAPQGEGSKLLAATFSDQKYACRVPEGGRMIRAYFGGEEADKLIAAGDPQLIRSARQELKRILGPLPEPVMTVTRRWPKALPQYGVGHGERMAELQGRVEAMGSLHLLGNAYRGVGLPELIRDGRAAARQAVGIKA